MRRREFLITATAAAVAPTRSSMAQAAPPALAVRSDFPGGSARIIRIDQATRTISVAPHAHPDTGWTVWWYFRVDGLTVGETVTLEINTTGFGRPDRAAFSHDDRNWLQTEPGEQRSRTLVVYRHKAQAPTIWFAWGPPFGLREADAFIARITRLSRDATRFDLGPTREGRRVPGILVRRPGKGRPVVWLQARQHAWEAGSTWTGVGLVEWLVSDDAAARRLRVAADVYFIPVMDPDRVEKGEGGKMQKPYSPNHDWGPHTQFFPQVKAAMDRLRALEAERRLAVFLDMHNPAPHNRNTFFYVPAGPLRTPERLRWEERFLGLAKEEISGPYGFTGQLGPIGDTFDPAMHRTAESWVASVSRPEVVALTLETTWNTPTGTQAGYRKVGEQVGRLIERHLREKSAST